MSSSSAEWPPFENQQGFYNAIGSIIFSTFSLISSIFGTLWLREGGRASEPGQQMCIWDTVGSFFLLTGSITSLVWVLINPNGNAPHFFTTAGSTSPLLFSWDEKAQIGTVGAVCIFLEFFHSVTLLSSLLSTLLYSINILQTVGQQDRASNPRPPLFLCSILLVVPLIWSIFFFVSDFLLTGSPVNPSQPWPTCLMYPNHNSVIGSASMGIPLFVIILANAYTYRKAIRAFGKKIKSGGVYTSRERGYKKEMAKRFVLYVVALVLCWLPIVLIQIVGRVVKDVHVIYPLFFFQSLWFSVIRTVNSFMYGRADQVIKSKFTRIRAYIKNAGYRELSDAGINSG